MPLYRGPGDLTHVFDIGPLEVKPGIAYFGSLHFEANLVMANEAPLNVVLPQKTYSGRAGTLGVVGVLLLPKREPIQVVGAKLSVKDEMSPVQEAFQRQVGSDSGSIEKSIVTVKAQDEM
jgi:hypothetical protein